MFIVCGQEQGEIEEFKTLKEALEFIKEIKKQDKRFGIQDSYYVEELEED